MNIQDNNCARAQPSNAVRFSIEALRFALIAAFALVITSCGGGGGSGGGSAGGGGATPANQTGSVAIAGTPAQKQTLTATVQDGNGVPATVTYQWMANGAAIVGASGNTYKLTQTEVGKTITVKATYTDNAGYGESPTSAATAVVADVNDPPTISFTANAVSVVNLGVYSVFHGAKVQPDGKIIATGTMNWNKTWNGTGQQFFVTRFNQDGTTDTSFGNTQGSTILTFGATYDDIRAKPILLPDGRILVAGSTIIQTTDGSDFAIAQLKPNGLPDTTFGSNGHVTFDFDHGFDRINALALTADNKILVAGVAYSRTNGRNEFALARLLPSGAMDSSFGLGGKVMTDFGSSPAQNLGINDVVQAADGSIYAVGDAKNAHSVLVRYDKNGLVDPSFGNQGKVNLPLYVANRIAFAADGGLLVAGSLGYMSTSFTVAKYLASGVPDTMFGINGLYNVSGGSRSQAFDLLVRNDGKILVAGALDSDSTTWGHANFAVALLTPTGQLDGSFAKINGGGTWIEDISGYTDTAYAMDLQSDGKIVVAGSAMDQGKDAEDAVIARVLPTGDHDITFGIPNGIFQERGNPAFLAYRATLLDPDVPAGGNYDGYRLTVARDGGGNPADVYSFTGTVTSAGGSLVYGGKNIATVNSSMNQLDILFNVNATAAAMSDVTASLQVSNPSQTQSGRTQMK